MQTDIVIFDNFHNSPLLSEFNVGVYPVEIVYATIEVKSILTKTELKNSLSAIRKIRKIGSKKHYVVTSIASKAPLRMDTQKLTLTVPPRSYVVAFGQRGLGKTYQDFCQTLRACLNEHNDHVHGVAVLENDWFAGRKPYRNPADLFGEDGNALLSLYSSILKGQQNFAVFPMDLDSYLKGTLSV